MAAPIMFDSASRDAVLNAIVRYSSDVRDPETPSAAGSGVNPLILEFELAAPFGHGPQSEHGYHGDA